LVEWIQGLKKMRRLLLVGLSFLAAVALSLQAEEATTTIKEGSPSEYVVKKGDTLWAIADRFLN
jgi:LysM repeat protein